MAVDDGPSRTSEVAKRLGEGTGYGSVYRDRLISAGLITSKNLPYGMVDFTTPYLREYLREHVASQVPGFKVGAGREWSRTHTGP